MSFSHQENYGVWRYVRCKWAKSGRFDIRSLRRQAIVMGAAIERIANEAVSGLLKVGFLSPLFFVLEGFP
jgi:hypothetical protein